MGPRMEGPRLADFLVLVVTVICWPLLAATAIYNVLYEEYDTDLPYSRAQAVMFWLGTIGLWLLLAAGSWWFFS